MPGTFWCIQFSFMMLDCYHWILDSGDEVSGSEDENEGCDDFDETSKDTEFIEDMKEGAEKDQTDVQTDCPICLSEFKKQRIGQPENCRHLFCSDCIKEWSKVSFS